MVRYDSGHVRNVLMPITTVHEQRRGTPLQPLRAVELPHTEVILTRKDEQRCRRHATKMQLRGKFGREADRHADQGRAAWKRER